VIPWANNGVASRPARQTLFLEAQVMSIEQTISLLTSLVGVGVSVLLAAIPWAYGVHGRLTMIETNLKELVPASERWSEMDRRLTRIEARIAE
jgi:hypothetical protein